MDRATVVPSCNGTRQADEDAPEISWNSGISISVCENVPVAGRGR